MIAALTEEICPGLLFLAPQTSHAEPASVEGATLILPVIFRLVAANIDDLDDDDGIPDTEEEFPYTPAEEVLILPVVIVEQLRFYLELTVVRGSDPLELVFAAAELLDNPDATNASFFDSNGVLTIPSIEIEGISYWRQFALVDGNPIRFRLVAEGLDDADDDDDGIPDVEDEFPYTPAENDPANIAGSWTFYFMIDPASQVEDTACEADPINSDIQVTIQYDSVASTSHLLCFF